MNDSNIFFFQEQIDIPLTGPNEGKGEDLDSRRLHQYCFNLNEKKKKFLTSASGTPHKLVLSSREENDITPFHSNAHNYEMISNPRDTPFFSLHGPEYNEIATFFDPRRTRTKDILGQTIYQQQAFVDTQEEIPATNDVLFESFFTDFTPNQSLELKPLDLDNLQKEDGELSKTFNLSSLTPDPDISSQNGLTPSIDDDFDEYRDLLIDVLVTKNPVELTNTLKTSKLLQKALDIESTASETKVVSNGDSSVNSFVEEKSVVGDKPLPVTPKVPVALQKKSPLLRLASDPNHSFVDEFDRSLQPSSSSTPKLKSRSNALTKRKKTELPIKKSGKSLIKSLLNEQMNKRLKLDKDTSVRSSNTVNDSPSSPSSSPQCKVSEQPSLASDPEGTCKNSEVLATTGKGVTNEVSADQGGAAINIAPSQLVPDAEIGSSNSTPSASSTESKSVEVMVEDDPTIGVKISDINLPLESSDKEGSQISPKHATKANDASTNVITLSEIELSDEPVVSSKDESKFASPEAKSNPEKGKQTLDAEKGNEGPSATPQTASSESEDILESLDKSVQKSISDNSTGNLEACSPVTNEKTVLRSKKPYFRNVSKQNSSVLGNNQPDKGAGSNTLLDAGLLSIKQIKGTAHQGPTSPSPVPELENIENIENMDTNVPKSAVVSVDEKFKQLAFKDRAIGKQLMKYCSCWVEETKHTACVDLYGEFLVTINNRYCQQLDMSVVNSALTVLSLNSDKLDPDNFILKTALFTSQLLKVLRYSNQAFD